MRLALHSVSYSGTWGGQTALSLNDFVDKAAALGFEGVELAAKRPHASPLDLDSRKRSTLRRRLADNGLSVCCMASYHDFAGGVAHPDMAHREKELVYLREVARLAQDLGCDLIRVYTGFRDERVSYRQQWDWCVAALREAAQIAAEHKMRLGVQNHSCIASHYQALLDMVREVGASNVGLVLDAPPLVDQGVDPVAAVKEVGELVLHSHLTEFVSRPVFNYHSATTTYHAAGRDVTAVPVGQGGSVDWAGFIRALKDIGYAGWLSYEMCSPLIGGGSEANLDRCARETLEFVRPLL
jgi:protein FrlC